MSEQSETPRTDDLHAQWGGGDANLRSRYFKMKILARSLERELSEVTRERDEIRIALAGTDLASLPSDFPTVRMAHQVRADHDKFLWQVRDTCARAEAAERELEALRGKLKAADLRLKMTQEALRQELATPPEK